MAGETKFCRPLLEFVELVLLLTDATAQHQSLLFERRARQRNGDNQNHAGQKTEVHDDRPARHIIAENGMENDQWRMQSAEWRRAVSFSFNILRFAVFILHFRFTDGGASLANHRRGLPSSISTTRLASAGSFKTVPTLRALPSVRTSRFIW